MNFISHPGVRNVHRGMETSDYADASSPVFTLSKVLKSFQSRTDTLFVDSLHAEITRHPELLKMTPEKGDANPPAILFTSRRKGYFKARALERVPLLEALNWARSRGELFVDWKGPTSAHYGRRVLAHALVMKYGSIVEPGKTHA